MNTSLLKYGLWGTIILVLCVLGWDVLRHFQREEERVERETALQEQFHKEPWEVTEVSVTVSAKRLEEALNSQDHEEYLDHFDLEACLERAGNGVVLPPDEQGREMSAAIFIRRMFDSRYGQPLEQLVMPSRQEFDQFKLLRVERRDQHWSALFRQLNLRTGKVDYLEYFTDGSEQSQTSDVPFVDVRDHHWCRLLSEHWRQQMVIDWHRHERPGEIAGLNPTDQALQEHAAEILRLMAAIAEVQDQLDDPAAVEPVAREIAATFPQWPELLRQTSVIETMYVIPANLLKGESRETLIRQLQTRMNDPGSLQELAGQYLGGDEPELALTALEALNRQVGGDVALNCQRAEVLFRLNRDPEGFRMLEELETEIPKLAETYRLAISTCIERGDFAGAVRWLERERPALNMLDNHLAERFPPEFVESAEYQVWVQDLGEQPEPAGKESAP